jgi:hypothetical protein
METQLLMQAYWSSVARSCWIAHWHCVPMNGAVAVNWTQSAYLDGKLDRTKIVSTVSPGTR